MRTGYFTLIYAVVSLLKTQPGFAQDNEIVVINPEYERVQLSSDLGSDAEIQKLFSDFWKSDRFYGVFAMDKPGKIFFEQPTILRNKDPHEVRYKFNNYFRFSVLWGDVSANLNFSVQRKELAGKCPLTDPDQKLATLSSGYKLDLHVISSSSKEVAEALKDLSIEACLAKDSGGKPFVLAKLSGVRGSGAYAASLVTAAMGQLGTAIKHVKEKVDLFKKGDPDTNLDAIFKSSDPGRIALLESQSQHCTQCMDPRSSRDEIKVVPASDDGVTFPKPAQASRGL